MKLECKGYAGHRWSEIPPQEGFHTVCVRCAVRHPIYGYPPKPKPTSILNGLPIPDNLLVGQSPVIDYEHEDWEAIPDDPHFVRAKLGAKPIIIDGLIPYDEMFADRP